MTEQPTTMKNLVFIDNRIQNYSVFKDNINSDSSTVVYDYYLDTPESIYQQLTGISSIDRISFVFHGLVLGSETYEIDFIQEQPFFTANDFSVGSTSTNYSANLQFLLDLTNQYSVSHIDFLGCNLLTFPAWGFFFQLFTDRGITVGASNDATGNLKYGGNWTLESTMEDVKQVYFTDGLLNYEYLLLYDNIINATQYYHDFYTYSVNNPTVLSHKIYNNSSILIYTEDISFGGMNILEALQILDSNGTTPYTIGIVDPSMNKVRCDLAFVDVFRKAFSDSEKSKLITYMNKTYKEPHTIADGLYTVRYVNSLFEVKNSSNVIMSDPISLTSSYAYIFDQSDSSNTGTTFKLVNSSNVEITTGVTKYGTPGTLNAYTMISPSSAISVYCNTPPVVTTNFTGSPTITTSTVGNYKVITITSVGNYTVTFNRAMNIEVLVVAGGGGGGYQSGGGGGAGGVIYNNNYSVSTTSISVSIGGGGGGGANSSGASNGGNSVFGSLTAIGGGKGGTTTSSSNAQGGSGGSGGGSCYAFNAGALAGGAGTPSQGFNGGSNIGTNDSSGSGGGGGASSAGGAAAANRCGNGGNGISISITGSPVIYGGGGGGGTWNSAATGGSGGSGGGGNGGRGGTYPLAGTNGYGGGGGGGGANGPGYENGASGGSGVVIIRHPLYA
jgi:hypothetical protein